LASKLITFAKAIDDFIIDRALQPAVNLAGQVFAVPLYMLAKVCTVLGAGVGVVWIHRFDKFPGTDFYQDAFSLGIMVVATFIQIRAHEAREPKQQAFMPVARVTGLLWRTLWLLDLASFPFQLPVEGREELAFNFVWTLLVVLPYWIICCRRPPPPVERRAMVFTPVPITVR
jgi:hypothetical protein